MTARSAVPAPPASARAPARPPLLSVAGVSLTLAGRRILHDIRLDVAEGEFLGLIGPNGGGKTSLLRMILGLVTPTHGTIQWHEDATGARPVVGYVPQRTISDRHYPLRTQEIVLQGMHGAMPLSPAQHRDAQSRAGTWLERVGLSAEAKTPFAVLSTGQQRRALMARALMNAPAALLIDEPTAGVDAAGQDLICAILRELTLQGTAILLVSHDIPLIAEYTDRIACLAVSLHWHGASGDLTDEIIRHSYRCELRNYDTSSHRRHVARGATEPASPAGGPLP